MTVFGRSVLMLVLFWLGATVAVAASGYPHMRPLDTRFGHGGWILVPSDSDYEWVEAMALDSQKRVVMSVNDRSSTLNQVKVVRLTPEGGPDTSFGVNAIYTQSCPGYCAVMDVAVMSDDHIVMLVYLEWSDGSEYDFRLIRLKADGSGTLPWLGATPFWSISAMTWGGPTSRHSWLIGIEPGPDDTLVLTVPLVDAVHGRTTGVARFAANGALDTTFNASGAAPGRRVLLGTDTIEPAAVKVMDNGKILVAGNDSEKFMQDRAPDWSRVGVWRLNADGSDDAGFGSGGLSLQSRPGQPPGMRHEVIAMTVSQWMLFPSPPQQQIVLLVRSNDDYYLMRLNGAGEPLSTPNPGGWMPIPVRPGYFAHYFDVMASALGGGLLAPGLGPPSHYTLVGLHHLELDYAWALMTQLRASDGLPETRFGNNGSAWLGPLYNPYLPDFSSLTRMVSPAPGIVVAAGGGARNGTSQVAGLASRWVLDRIFAGNHEAY